jgi:hypothetical protein
MKKYLTTINGHKQTIQASSHKAAVKQALKNITWPKDTLYNDIHLDVWVKREE